MTDPKSENTHTQDRVEKPAAPFKGTHVERPKEPTHCENCGRLLGIWFSLYDKAYCSPCFHSKFWTPFQSVPEKDTDTPPPLVKSVAPPKVPPKARPKAR